MTTQDSGSLREDRDENLTLVLPNGRTIGYARYGAACSPHPTTIYLHGYPSSRLEAATVSQQLLAAKLQVISIDRPGLGLSTPSNTPFDERTVLHHAEDVGQPLRSKALYNNGLQRRSTLSICLRLSHAEAFNWSSHRFRLRTLRIRHEQACLAQTLVAEQTRPNPTSEPPQTLHQHLQSHCSLGSKSCD